MSETRLCGYCRNAGHMKPACPEYLELRNICLTHTPIQRKILIETMANAGLGNGAMIAGKDWWGKEYIGIIQNFEWVAGTNFIDPRNLKYCKKVKLNEMTVQESYFHRRIHASFISMSNGTTERSNIALFVSEMFLNNDPRTFFDSRTTILTPSYQCDYDPAILVKNVLVPERLKAKSEDNWQTGIMPPSPS